MNGHRMQRCYITLANVRFQRTWPPAAHAALYVAAGGNLDTERSEKNGETCENGSTRIKKYFVVAIAIIVQREIVDVIIIRTTTTNNINFDKMIATHSGQSIGGSHNSGQYIRRPGTIRRKRADSSLHLSDDWNENERLTDVNRR